MSSMRAFVDAKDSPYSVLKPLFKKPVQEFVFGAKQDETATLSEA